MKELQDLYRKITEQLIERELTVTTMESCTSGLIASLITDTEGASAVLKGALITYSNEAKIMAGVPESVIGAYGVYSKETAAAMAKACRDAFCADIGIGVTGSFGNADPANPDSVPGSVDFAIDAFEKVRVCHLDIPEQASRHDYKTYTAFRIGDALLKILEDE